MNLAHNLAQKIQVLLLNCIYKAHFLTAFFFGAGFGSGPSTSRREEEVRVAPE
jgi:hypothetical protein